MDRALGVTEADVVVVGAGALGLAAGYHLAKLGAGRVVVLDKFAPGSQSSGRAAGLFKRVQADEPLTRLSRLSVDVVSDLERELDRPLLVRSGSILAARTPAHAALIRDEVANAQSWGAEAEWIDAAEAGRRAPYLTGEGLRAAVYVPGDCYIEEPIDLLEAYREATTRRGGQVIGETPVTRIDVERGRVVGVGTPRGDIRTERVVDAAGGWVRSVADLAGTRVAAAPYRHQLVITEPIAGVPATDPITRLIDASSYLRPARGGIMFGGFESDPLAFDPALAGPSFTMDGIPLDLGVIEGFRDALAGQVAALADAPLAEHRGGVFTMTPDARFLAGPVAGLEGFWLATGCNGSGFSLAAGLGRLLAEWMLGGEPSLDMSTWDPRRFKQPFSDDELLASGAYRYANYYTPPEYFAT
ncbi:MAG TPA: FAD-binding oxidoreductase [Thermomicrobiales bacterium]|nr:FAD-binding oxidoreductase [Thermomicrobiales bacterium]